VKKKLKLFANGVSYKKKHKKASAILDVLIGSILFLTVAIATVFGFRILSEINDEIQADADISTIAKTNSQNVTTEFPKYMDNAFLMMVVLFWVFLLVSSFFIDTYPVFFVVSFILLIFVFVIGMAMANTYEEVVTESGISTFADSFSKMNWIMEHLLIVLIVMGLSSAFVLYANSSGGKV
jgi:hypothetical protein